MDRQAFTTGQLVPNVQLLGMEKSKLVALGYALEAIMGAGGTVVSGLACTPTATPSLSVVVGRGSIMTTTAIDTVAYSDLGTDSNATIKQGILQEPGATLTLTPPTTPGYSQTYLIQAKQADGDNSTVVPFYNAANPAQQFNGPNNSGNATLTLRQSQCVVSLKAGAAASTGTQTAPSPDIGNVGLYTITLVNGQTTITAAQIVQLASAPFVPVTLPGVPAGVQAGTWTFGQDTGAADAYVVTTNPNNGGPVTNQRLFVKFSATNATTSPVLNVNGTGNKALLRADGSAPAAGDVPARWRTIFFDGTAWRFENPVASDTGSAAATFLAANSGGIGYTAPGTYTFTVPANVFRIFARVWGGGGGGGGTNTAGGVASGGGAGGYAEGWYATTPGQQLTATVGARGAAGNTTPTSGGTGGTSSITTAAGATLISATGGGAGGGYAGSGINTTSAAGGVGSGGQFNAQSGAGGVGFNLTGPGIAAGGIGGGAQFGGFPSPQAINAAGQGGYSPGGGGQGGVNGTAGGGGGAGAVIISY